MQNNRKKKAIQLMSVVVFLLAVPACDDGNLNTVLTKETLAEYMNDHPDLLFLYHGIDNFREPLYLCFFDHASGALYNIKPIGKNQSTEGISHGELSAVELPVNDWQHPASLFWVTNGALDCPSPEDAPVVFDLVQESYNSFPGNGDDMIPLTFLTGHLSTANGGESWQFCDDEICPECNGNLLSTEYPSTHEGDMVPPPGKTEIRFSMNYGYMGAGSGPLMETTLCWDPDDSGSEPPINLTQFRSIEEIDGTLWGADPASSVLPPMTTGTIYLNLGLVDCSSAPLAEAIATLALPADATIGPPGAKIVFDTDTINTISVLGSTVGGIPKEAGLRIIPIPHLLQ